MLEVTIKSKTELLRVATIYRTGTPSTRGRSIFTDEFDDYLQLLSQKKGEKFLCGDFNIHVEEDNCLDKTALYHTTDSYDFHQVVNQSTHRDGGTLDLVFAQRGSKYFTSVTKSLFVYDLCHSLTSDHKFIEFRIPFTRKNNPTKYIKLSYRNFKNVNSYAFSADVISFLNEKSNDFFLENAESATNLFHNSLNHVIEQYAPLIETSVKQKKTEFTNSDITSLRRQRRKAERDYRKNKNLSDKILYQSLVKEVKTLVRGTRNDYYRKELALCKGNKKNTFKLLNGLIGNSSEHPLPAHEDETELCNDFEQFFANKIHNIRNNISNVSYTASNESKSSIPNKQCTTSFNCFDYLSDDDITKVFASLPNKFCKLDPVSSELFKLCLVHLLPYVKHIINSSLQEGLFPDQYKQALVKPKIKGHTLDKDDHLNFRPLNNLSFLSKAVERCVLNQLVNYLESNHMFSNFQSAYRKFHSCETAITKITNDILTSLDNKQCSFLLFLDLSAAFDTIDHSILLTTLQVKYGINGSVLHWINSYLSNRKCYVNINNSYSKGIYLLFGVPQGSILGPILFILYISDIEHIAKCNGFNIHIYADDTQLYIAFEKCDILSTVSDIEQCLREIRNWMSTLFLKINEDKTKFLMISSNDDLYNVYTDLCISFSGNIITPSLNAVNLGVTLDSTMSMETYIKNIISKGYFKLNNFWRNADKLTYDLKLQLVTAYILPIIDYCNITFLAASKLNINKLQKLLNSSIRFIFNLTGKRYRNAITPYMKKLHILPVEYRIKYKVSLTVYKCFHDLAPDYLKELIQSKVTYSHLRSSNDLYSLQTVIPKSKHGESTFSYVAPIIWNELPQDIKLSPNVECFKKRLKTHYFIEYYGDD